MNQCNFIGRLGRDPEKRFVQSGKAVVTLSLAVSERYKGEEKTEWVRVIFFDKAAEVIDEYMQKGSRMYVSGKMQTQKWQDKSGNDRYTTEIIGRDFEFLGERQGDTQNNAQNPAHSSPQETADFDDDIPF